MKYLLLIIIIKKDNMIMSKLYNTLCEKNVHKRDENITFQEEGHKYTIHNDLGSTYTSVTTWNHEHFPKFDADKVIDRMMKGKNWNPDNKYWGKTKEEIKQLWSDNGASQSGAGTHMHYEIECFMNNNVLDTYTHKDLLDYYHKEYENQTQQVDARNTIEWEYFLKFVDDNSSLKPYRTEWTVYDEDLKLSGSIDMVYENDDGSLMIYDWKRSKDISRINRYDKFANTYCISHLPDANFWHYSLQLNTYKCILERKYGKRVTNLRLVRLHPNCKEDNDNTYELIDVPDLSKEVEQLFNLRIQELTNTVNNVKTDEINNLSIKT